MASRILPLALAVAISLTACGTSDPAPDADDRAFPSSAVSAWLEGVDAVDVARVDGVVADTPLAIVVAVENRFDAVQTLVLLDDGLPPDLASGYWASFGRDFAEFSGRSLGGLTVGEFEELPGGNYAVVDLGQEGSATDVVVTRASDGWRVDMVATLGAGLVAPLGRFFADLPETAEGDEVRAVLRENIVPSLQIVADRTSEPSLAADAERLIVEIESYIS